MINHFSSLPLRGVGLGVSALLAATSLVLGGCSDDQTGSGGGSGGGTSATSTSGGTTSTGATTGGTTTGTGGGQAEPGIAVLNSKITQVSATDKMKWLATGEALDPTTLIVVVSTEQQSCNAPVFDLGTKNHHQILIGLPQAMQKVGKYDISSTDVIAYGTTWLSDGMGSGGGGMATLGAGTVEVLSIDATTINVRLAGLINDFVSENGDYLVTRCP